MSSATSRLIATDANVYPSSLLTYDAVRFNRYLDTILAAHLPPPGSTRQNQSPWLFLDAANTVFQTAKRRVYTGTVNDTGGVDEAVASSGTLRPVLEEQPKWNLLADILDEIDRDVYFNPVTRDDSYGSTLIMCGDQNSCHQIREYLQTMTIRMRNLSEDSEKVDDSPSARSASFMMRKKLRDYLNWKKDFAKVSASLFAENQTALNGVPDQRGTSGYRGKAPPNKRRRVRGGSAAAAGSLRAPKTSSGSTEEKASQVASLLADVQTNETDLVGDQEIAVDTLEDLEDYFELYEMNDLVIIHPFEGDMDEHVLEEVKPRYIIMYEPDAAFIRRVEVYRSSHNDRNVRVYFMYYGGSVEEQRYLSAVRKEKDAFTRLIKEKGVCDFPTTRMSDAS